MRWLLVAIGTALAGPALAAAPVDFPSRPVRIVTPFPPGSVTDILARPLAQHLAETWRQSVVVENRAGAGGIIGATVVAKATPDGHSLLLGTNGTNAINASLYKSLPYDPVKDFAAVTPVASSHLLLVVHPTMPARNVSELIALARAKPGQLTFGSGGSGTTPHLAGELFNVMAGVQLVHVPYKGSPQSTLDLIAGRLSMIFANAATSVPHVKTGKLNVIAVTGPQRDPGLPQVPTVSESGLPGFSAESWFGLFAPAGTPAPVVAKLSEQVRGALASPAMVQSFAAIGLITMTATPAEFDAYVRQETAKWRKVVNAAGAKAD